MRNSFSLYFQSNFYICPLLTIYFMITKKQGIQILQRFFQSPPDFDHLQHIFSIKKAKLESFVKEKFKQIIFEIQYQLFNLGKITELKFYDNSSDQMFTHLLNFTQYFPQKLYDDFIFQEKCRYGKIQKSSTAKKIELYNVFYDYSLQKGLFSYASEYKNDEVLANGLTINPNLLYSPNQLEILSIYYDFFDGKAEMIEKYFNQRGFTDDRFCGNKLRENIKNIQLLGIYRCYLKSIKSRGGKGITWDKFIQDQEDYLAKIKDWNPDLKFLLFKFGLGQEILGYQIRIIARKLGRRFNDKPFIQVFPSSPVKNDQKYCNTPQINKLRQELIAVLKGKIWFNSIRK